MLGARITTLLAQADSAYSSCIVVNATHDLHGGRTESVVVSGPVQPTGDYCGPGATITRLHVRVAPAQGVGGFRTGAPPLLDHLEVLYHLAE